MIIQDMEQHELKRADFPKQGIHRLFLGFLSMLRVTSAHNTIFSQTIDKGFVPPMQQAPSAEQLRQGVGNLSNQIQSKIKRIQNLLIRASRKQLHYLSNSATGLTGRRYRPEMLRDPRTIEYLFTHYPNLFDSL